MTRLTITLEPKSPQTNAPTPCYVARDENGVWVTWGPRTKDTDAMSGRDLAKYLFHDDEIVSVEIVTQTLVTIGQ
jgi:hypothetical protein